MVAPVDASQNPKSTNGFTNITRKQIEPTQQTQHIEGALDLKAYIDQINREQVISKPTKQAKNKLAGAFRVKNEVEVVQQ